MAGDGELAWDQRWQPPGSSTMAGDVSTNQGGEQYPGGVDTGGFGSSQSIWRGNDANFSGNRTRAPGGGLGNTADPWASANPMDYAQPNYDDLYGSLWGQVDLSGFDARAAGLRASQARIAGGANAQMGAAKRNNDIALARIGLQEEGNGVNIAATYRQGGVIDKQWGLTNERYTSDKGYLGKLRGFAGTGKQIGLDDATQTRDRALTASQLGYDKALYGLNSDATARGAYGAEGTDFSRGALSKEKSLQDLEANQTFGIRERTVNLGYDKELAGLDKQGVDLDFDLRGAEIDKDEAKAKLGDRLKQLDILARDFGLQRDQLAAQLQGTLAGMGMQKEQALAGILDGLASNDVARNQASLAAATQVMQQGQIMIGQGASPTGWSTASGQRIR